MSFNDALTIVLGKEGMAAKTESMVGYLAKVSPPDGSSYDVGVTFRKRGSESPFSSCPVYWMTVNSEDEYVTAAIAGTEVSLTSELMKHVMSDDWYVCYEDEATEALGKANDRVSTNAVTALENAEGEVEITSSSTVANTYSGTIGSETTLQDLMDIVHQTGE